MGFIYSDYREFIIKPFYFTYADIISIENKPNAMFPYKLLKLKSDDGFEFYTKSYDILPLSIKRVRVEIFPDSNITFFKFLGTFFIDSRLKEVVPVEKNIKEKVVENIKDQHND
ncbi:MAG: ComEC/Rec2 family competence protein, partial [Campylobacterales bacterium]|nr:ComEC/Rec2 family competence protein [Campylobacterales bacterium]